MTHTQYEPLTHEQLTQFTGDDVRYRHGLNPRVLYTRGVQFVAERAGAYWLLDAIASYLTPRFVRDIFDPNTRVGMFNCWQLDVDSDQSAVLTAREYTQEEPFLTQEFDFTDFPLESISIFSGFDGARWTLFLPLEE